MLEVVKMGGDLMFVLFLVYVTILGTLLVYHILEDDFRRRLGLKEHEYYDDL